MPAPENTLSADFSRVVEGSILPWPGDAPDAILRSVQAPRLRMQFESEFAYLRGDYGCVIQLYHQMEGDEAAKLRASSLAIAAAVSAGNYPLYLKIEAYLKGVMEENSADAGLCTFAELCLATAWTGAIAPNMAPGWLINGDFVALPEKTRPDAYYKRAKYFQSLGKFESMMAVSETALGLCFPQRELSFHSICFRVACAIACACMGREEEAKHWLSDALALAVPHGFLTPFAESAPAFGGLLETLLEREYPAQRGAVLAQWQRVFANWMTFHNRFTKDNITSILSLREHEIASMVVHHVPRAQIAKQFHVSPGRLNNIIKEIYEKLFVSGREELSQYIL